MDVAYGKRISEGLKIGIGAALLVDAKEVFAEGELDAQAYNDFTLAADNVLAMGVDDDGEATYYVEATSCITDSCSDDFAQILSEAFLKFEAGFQQASAKKLAEETEMLSQLVTHIAKVIAIYDGYRNSLVFEALAERRASWASAFAAMDGSTWPPPGVVAEPLSSNGEDETAVFQLCRVVASFCTRGAAKARKLSPDMAKAVLY